MPIDQTMRGLALEIDASTDPAPETQPLLEYRFINLANTQTILARIKGIPRSDGGGQLAFETNAGADTATQRMLIDNQGNVGIGTENPGARLDVAGDAKFNGALNVQGALTASGLEVSGLAKIGGDLSVTGKLTAASFAGNGAALSNVTPADSSITSAKLAVDSASLSKVTGGKMVISADNVGIGTANPGARLEVAGDAKFNGPLNVQGALTVSGVAKIGGDLSVTGTLTAASFRGNGAGLSNVTPADGSITNAKLAQDAASLSKVTGGKMVVQGDSVGIGGRLEVNGAVKFQGPLAVSDKIGIGVSDVGFDAILDVGSRMRVRQGNSASSGIWFSQRALNGDAAFVGMATDNHVGFYGNRGAGWGLAMQANNGNVGIGIGATAPGFKLDVGDRIRLRQGPHGTAGIWLFQTAPNVDAAFFGMHADNLIGFYGAYGRPQGGGVGWGLMMRTDTGDVQIAGRLTARAKAFKIDHPLDPANKYLYHSSVESPDVMNIYNGNIITDAEGNATVMLPDYFEALNGDFRYQLTVIGKLAQAAVASEIENNRFVIKTNQPNMKVSWQVTGIRQDASAKAHRLPVEEEKPEAERGLYLHPEDYGQPKTRGIGFVRSPEPIRDRLAQQAIPSVPQ
jgi:cytoskeletal protein CcmA (bactofilin family)